MPDNIFYIAIVGSGNLATHLGVALVQAGHIVTEVYSRNPENAQLFARALNCNAKVNYNLNFVAAHSDFIFLCISDDALPQVANYLKVSDNTCVVHTSGSTSLEILKHFTRFGVMYPIQTFNKDTPVDFKTIPIMVEGNTEEVTTHVFTIANTLSSHVIHGIFEQRRTTHLAAVFANNFTNHLLGIAFDLLVKNKLNYSLLKPLVEETFKKAFLQNPVEVQTGPAKRNDVKILEEHIKMLKDTPYTEVYQTISESILAGSNKNS